MRPAAAAPSPGAQPGRVRRLPTAPAAADIRPIRPVPAATASGLVQAWGPAESGELPATPMLPGWSCCRRTAIPRPARGTAVLVPPAKDQRQQMPPILQKIIAEWRNRIEATLGEITDQVELARHGAHSFWAC